jgi:DNA invertase Pin-like site-specific DNA recombinase
MIEDAISKLVHLANKQDENGKLIADSLNNLAQAIQGMQPQVVDTSASEMFEKMIQERVSLSVSHVSQDVGQTGHNSPRPKTAADKVREYLDANPQDKLLPVRDLADKLGVGKSTVSRVLNED